MPASAGESAAAIKGTRARETENPRAAACAPAETANPCTAACAPVETAAVCRDAAGASAETANPCTAAYAPVETANPCTAACAPAETAAVCRDAAVLAQTTVEKDIRLLRVRWPADAPAPHAGQFFTLRAWAASEPPFLSRPISVHCWQAEDRTLSFLYQVKGPGTEKLARLAPGDTVQTTGPLGNGFDAAALAAGAKRIVLAGGGIGTAPLYQLARELAAAGCRPDVCCGFADVPYCMEAYRGTAAQVRVATDSGRYGRHGFVTQLYDPADYDLVLVCGPAGMMKAAAAACRAAGTRCLVSLEGKMACGIGACLGCTCETTRGEAKRICADGPVFDAREVY